MRNKLIAIGVGLMGYGALWGWALTSDFYKRRMEAGYDSYDHLLHDKTDQIFDLKDRLDRARQTIQGFSSNPPQATVIFSEPDDNGEVEDEEEIDEEAIEQTRSNLQNLIDHYVKDDSEAEKFAEIAQKQEEIDRAKPPYVISRDEFAFSDAAFDDFEKITLTYYPRDRVLLDDDDEVVDDIPALVGWRSLSSFGGESGDPDVVFVRNPRLETDFEVVRDTENELPAHVRWGLPREEFEAKKAAGLVRFRPEDT